jgi:hypothetical protein
MPEQEAPPEAPSYGVASGPPPVAEAPPSEPAKIGPLGRLTGVLLSPGETFQDINRKPTIIAPVIVALLLAVGGYFIFVSRVNPDWNAIVRTQIKKQVERSGQSLSEEDLDRRVSMGAGIAKLTPLLLPVFIPIGYAVLAGIFALGMVLIQAKTTYKKIFSVVAWTFASISLVSLVVTTAALMIQDKETLSALDPSRFNTIAPTSVGAFLDSSVSPALRTLAGWLDVFTIWRIVALTIGLTAVAGSRKITTSKTATIVVGVFIIGALIATGWSAITGQ